jgi:hypothetical protein
MPHSARLVEDADPLRGRWGEEIYDDPEEKVRADFWAELIYRYSYEPQRIGVEITVPDRTPKDSAVLVVFRDDERKDPFRGHRD